MPMREIAYAKLNLALHVRAREADGYHRIETIFAFCEDGDVVTAELADELSLTVTGPFAGALAGEGDNLVLQAARRVGAKAALGLDKRLPVAAGLGGGSADAAAVLRLFGGTMDDAVALGADVPACRFSRTARGEGRGDRIERSRGAPAWQTRRAPRLFVALTRPADWAEAWSGAHTRNSTPPSTTLAPNGSRYRVFPTTIPFRCANRRAPPSTAPPA